MLITSLASPVIVSLLLLLILLVLVSPLMNLKVANIKDPRVVLLLLLLLSPPPLLLSVSLFVLLTLIGALDVFKFALSGALVVVVVVVAV